MVVAADVERTELEHGSRQGLTTLAQRFVFSGDGLSAAGLASLLMHAPLVGERSVFGNRPGREEPAAGSGSRTVRNFSPAPGFRFDVELTRLEETILVRFSQPGRSRPYLQGQLAWILEDVPTGVALDEQVNTDRAMTLVDEPLSGARSSLRRWLFFRVGHVRVMRGATRNLAALVTD